MRTYCTRNCKAQLLDTHTHPLDPLDSSSRFSGSLPQSKSGNTDFGLMLPPTLPHGAKWRSLETPSPPRGISQALSPACWPCRKTGNSRLTFANPANGNSENMGPLRLSLEPGSPSIPPTCRTLDLVYRSLRKPAINQTPELLAATVALGWIAR